MTSFGCVGGGPAKRSKSSRLVWGWVGVLGCSDGGVFGALDGKVGCCVISSRGDFGGDCETGCEIGCEIESFDVDCIGISTTGLVCEVGVLGGVRGGAVGCDFCSCGWCCCGGCDGAVFCCGICGFSSFSFFFLLSE